jgi:hypothetical protein
VEEGRFIDVDPEPRNEEGYDQADEEVAHGLFSRVQRLRRI